MLFTYNVNAQNKVLKMQLQGKNYDSLFIYEFKNVPHRIKIRGIKQKNYSWYFTIPDSVYNTLPDFVIVPSTFDFKTNTSPRIRFYAKIDNDSCFINSLNFQDKETIVKAKYASSFIYNALVDVQMPNGKLKSNISAKFVEDRFTIDCDTTSDVYVRMLEPYYSAFIDIKDRGYDYKEFFNYYLKLAKRFPNSRYLMINLSEKLGGYQSVEDVQKIYDCLSNKYKDTRWGKNIRQFLKSRFENMMLTSVSSGNIEPIIQDSTVYNLVVFSASWCGPCRREVPYLKDIYRDLKSKLKITYITIDEPETIDMWKEFMQKEQIPWRSLSPGKNINYVRHKYYLDGVPYNILISPSMKRLVLDIRIAKDRAKLYEIVNR